MLGKLLLQTAIIPTWEKDPKDCDVIQVLKAKRSSIVIEAVTESSSLPLSLTYNHHSSPGLRSAFLPDTMAEASQHTHQVIWISTQSCTKSGQKKKFNIQQSVFAGGHPPNY